MAQLKNNSSQEEYNNLISTDQNVQNLIDTNSNINTTDNIDNIDINEYKLAEEEEEFGAYTDLLNIYNVYYKTLFNKLKESTMFDEIDSEDITSTNRCLEILYDEIVKYKNSDKKYITLYDPEEYKKLYLESNNKLPEYYQFYLIEINNNQKVTHNLITALTYINSFDWKNLEWSINQINEF